MFQEFLFGLQNIVKLKCTLLDCWDSSKNSVHDNIKVFPIAIIFKHCIGKKCDKIFVKKL
ncbi:hypothetical protein T12_12509 [Trichinella patagoniensis]|uniref:Uncharacterized protein n=1 Tax=Trichinella patagoniensis TaxID=990121 RepID=A0A0V0YXP7_9BILA|nr:hypothetical protein T12_12509 [Trichinella patagoniensis]